MSASDEPQHQHPAPQEGADSRLGLLAPLNLQPPGDSSDISVGDLIGVIEVRLHDRSECFILITTKGLRHAPVNPQNRSILSSLVGIQRLPSQDAGDVEFANMLSASKAQGTLKDATLVNDEEGNEWIIVQAGKDAKAFAYTKERYEALEAHEFAIQRKNKKSLRSGPSPNF